MPGSLGKMEREHIRELFGHGTRQSYGRGGILIHEGQRSPHLFFLLTGQVALAKTSRSGRSFILGLRGPGRFVGMSLLDGGPYAVTATALTPTCALRTRVDAVQDLATRSTALTRLLLHEAITRARETERRLVSVGSEKVASRVLDALGEFAAYEGTAVGTDQIHVEVPLTQQQFAAWVGTSRESLNRALSRLRAEGAIGRLGRTFVLDRRRVGRGPARL